MLGVCSDQMFGLYCTLITSLLMGYQTCAIGKAKTWVTYFVVLLKKHLIRATKKPSFVKLTPYSQADNLRVALCN